MGFDNECIPNIQSLRGEYFCPVCRLLVYPNEALQSQCTHLYCKPCLTYVVSTTRACPYDGYLVTEADSKPLVETNKALAETIGKIVVHCLYQRSGCTWQGALSESTSHCSGCAFGNSPVVCNRCGIQIVHRQVQEHAQNCLGVQRPDIQQAENAEAAAAATSTALSGGQTAMTTTQANTSQAIAAPGPDSNQQPGANPTAQAVSALMLTQEQWYQQQYQQYYQQFSGHYPYGQYPYQQKAVAQILQPHLQSQALQQSSAYVQPPVQSQPQVQTQAQVQPQSQVQVPVQPQSHTVVEAAPPSQSQNQAMVSLQPQTHPQVMPPHSQVPSQAHPPSQGHPHLQAQLYSQPQPVPLVHLQTHVQNAQAPQYPLYPGQMHHPRPHSQTNPVQTSQPPYPNAQMQHPLAQVVTSHQNYPQPQPTQQSQVEVPQSNMPMHHQGGIHQAVQSVQVQNQHPQPASNLRPPLSHTPMPNQQPPALGQFPSIRPTQQPPRSSNSHQSGVLVHQHSLVQSVQQPPLQQPLLGQISGTIHNPFMHHQVAMQSLLRPQGPAQFTQQYSQSTQPHRPVMANHGVLQQPHQHSAGALQGRPVQLGPNHPVAGPGDIQRTEEKSLLVSEGQSGKQSDHTAERGKDKKAGSIYDAAQMKSLNTETDTKPSEETKLKENPESEQTSRPNLEPCPTKSEVPPSGQMVKEEASGTLAKSVEHPVLDGKDIKNGPAGKVTPAQAADWSDEKMGKMNKTSPQMRATLVINQRRNQPPLDHGSNVFQPRAAATSMLQAQPRAPHHLHTPGHPPTVFRPHGPGNLPGVAPHPASAPSFNRELGRNGPAHYISEGPYNQGLLTPSHTLKTSPNAINSHVPFGFRHETFKPLSDDWLNPISVGPARHREFEEDIKHFSRPPYVDKDPGLNSGAYRGYGMDVPPRPHEKHGPDYHTGASSRLLQERPLCLPEDGKGRSETAPSHPDFLGPGPGFGHQHIDGTRTPFGEYPGMSSRLHVGPGGRRMGLDDIDGRESHRFGLTSHLHRGKFEDPANFRIGEHLRSGEQIGLDVLPTHVRRGDHLGPGGLPGHLGLEERVAFGGFPPRRLGEPGFRSRFSLHGYPDDGGLFAGRKEPFEISRKRKPASMGWCRICEVDCETVEGLDLHSQTKEHQKRSMDVVATIKQNAKKHKITSGDRASLMDASRTKSASVGDHGSKN